MTKDKKLIVLIDTIALIVSVFVTGFFLDEYNVAEFFYEYSRAHENYNLDEILLTIGFSSLYMFIYILRRNNELRKTIIEADNDPLVGVYNRRKGHELIVHNINRVNLHKEVSSLIMFDIDNFKSINDSYGHNKGDYVLKEIADIVDNMCRAYDILIRWGGEEFIILCTKTNLEDTYSLANRIRIAIENHNFDEVGQVTASFGVTSIVDDENINKIIDRVDKNLYESKKNGKNMVTKY